MGLSADLISQFVKATKDDKKTPTETTVYGTIEVKDGSKYIILDGDTEGQNKIPLSNNQLAVTVVNGDRVRATIKNHNLVVTSNVYQPSASAADVEKTNDRIDDFDVIVADKVSSYELQTERARIDTLVAEDAVIQKRLSANEADIVSLEAENATIKGTLSANSADISKLKTDKLDANTANAMYATIGRLEAAEADIHDLNASYGEFVEITTDSFEAVNAGIEDLQANKADVNDAKIMKADIEDLKADVADIDNLRSEVADVNTLIFGSATGDVIHSSFANAVIAQLGNAQIKSAMIESVSANKMTAGDINTNKVRVKSEDGSLLISDETLQISDANRVRVQIGKDASGDYSINIWDQNGNLMFSEGGITDSAIKDAIIRNDMVSDTANIAAHKLDIDSLFKEINGSTKTIKSTRVHLDEKNQSLDVAFKAMETDVSGLENTVGSQGTQISAIQGQITSKVWQQDIKTAIDNIEVSGRNLYVVKNSVEGFLITSNANLGEMDGIRQEHTSEYIPVREGESYVFQVWTTVDERDINDPNLWMAYELYDADKNFTTLRPSKCSMNKLPNGQCYDIFEVSIPAGVSYIRVSARLYSDGLIKLEKGNVPTEWSPAPEDVEDELSSLSTQYSAIEQTVNSISTTVAEHTSTINSVESRIGTAETTISQHTTSIGLCATKTEMQTAKSEAINSANANTSSQLTNYSTTAQMNAAIQVSANSVQSSVSSTYATKESVNRVKIGVRNLYIEKTAVNGYLSSSGDGTITAPGPVTKEKTSDYIPVTPGDEMRFQIWVTTPADSYIWYAYQFFIEDGSILDTNRPALHLYDTAGGFYHRTYDPIVVPADAVYMRVSARLFNDGRIKVEIGNKATDWTPAPEDAVTHDDVQLAQSTAEAAQETASNAETLIQQLSDSISTLVTDGNGTSLMTQTEDGWTFSTADIQANVSNVADSLNTLTNELGSTAHTVDVLKQAVTDLGEIAEYVKIGTYDGEPCIELGESDSEFKMRITNTRILFMEGSNVVAHISNQSLHIKKAVIEEELQQGGFVWKVRSNGNMGLVWKGVSS